MAGTAPVFICFIFLLLHHSAEVCTGDVAGIAAQPARFDVGAMLFCEWYLFCRNRFDFAQNALWQSLHSDTASSGFRDEILGIDIVECSKIAHVCQKAGGLEHPLKAYTCSLQNCANIFAALLCLGCNAFGNIPCGGINRNLSGSINNAVYFKSLRIGANSTRCFCGF